MAVFRLLLCLMLLAAGGAAAQNIFVRGRVLNGRDNIPINSASVTLMSLVDTSTYEDQTGVDGKFRFYRVRLIGKYLLVVRAAGFANYVKAIEVRGTDDDLGNLVMVDSARLMQEAVIKAGRKAYTVKGDTVEYSASYYKTNPDMDAVYLLNKMPGIDVEGMRAQGDSISQLQINGIVVFGDRPTDILRQLPAGFVDKVQLFNDSTNRPRGSTAQWKVLNIKTNQSLALPKGKATAGGGTAGVFIVGANAIQQKEGSQLTADLSLNRGGIRSGMSFYPGYPYTITGNPLTASASLSYSRAITPKDRLELSYRISDVRNRYTASSTEQYNLPGGSQSFTRTNNLRNSHRPYHSLNTKLTHKQANKNRTELSAYVRIDNQTNDDTVNLDALIAGVAQASNSSWNATNRSKSYGGAFRYFNDANEKRGFEAGVTGHRSTSRDEAASRGFNRIADTAFEQGFINYRTVFSDNLNAYIKGNLRLNARHTLNATLDADYDAYRSGQSRTLFSPATGLFDHEDADFTYRLDYNTMGASAELKDVLSLDSGAITIEGGSGVQYFSITEASGRFSKGFVGLNPFLILNRKFSALKKFRVEVVRTTELPYFDDINPVIVSTAPYLYSIGSLDIRPAARYHLYATYESPLSKKGAMFNTHLYAFWIHNQISQALLIPADRDFYFEGKAIPPGVRLSYAQNVGDNKYLSYWLGVDAPVSALKSTVKVNASFSGHSSDALLNYRLSTTTSYDYSASATINSIISTSLDFVLYGSAGYNYTVQRGDDGSRTSRWVQRYQVNALLTAALDKRQSLRLETNLNRTSGLYVDKPTTYCLLDPRYQVKLLKNSQLALSLTLHDALNSYKNFGTEFRANSIYSYYNGAIGRYVLLMGQYSF